MEEICFFDPWGSVETTWYYKKDWTLRLPMFLLVWLLYALLWYRVIPLVKGKTVSALSKLRTAPSSRATNRGTAARKLNLSRWAVSVNPGTHWIWDWWSQRRCGRRGKEKGLFSLLRIEHQFLVTETVAYWLTELTLLEFHSWLPTEEPWAYLLRI
jgi:hypothetical protein